MIKDSGKKLFDVVLVWKFDRFARNRFDSANYKMILKKNGVHLISVMEPIAEGSQGILVETLLEGMAEYYSAELSEKVIRGQTENALKGKCTGGTGTIGYKIDEDKFYHLDPLTAPLVLEAFQRYDNGDKMVEIVNLLNDKGCPQYAGRQNDPQQREHHVEEPPVHWRIVFPGYRCAGCDSGYCSERLV